jgi:hypothetical protein
MPGGKGVSVVHGGSEVSVRRTWHRWLWLRCWCRRTIKKSRLDIDHSKRRYTYRLVIFASRPRNHISRTRLCPTEKPSVASPTQTISYALLGLFRRSRLRIDELFPEAHQAAHHATDITLQVADTGRHESLAGFRQEIGFLDFPFCGVDVRQVEGTRGWTGVSWIGDASRGRAYLAE